MSGSRRDFALRHLKPVNFEVATKRLRDLFTWFV